MKRQYGVPAEVGMRVTVDGDLGKILGFDQCDRLQVEFANGDRVSAHPTWRVVYHTPDGDVEFGMENSNA